MSSDEFVSALAAVLKDVSISDKPIFVLFKANWCGDCVRTEPGVDAAANEASVRLIKVPVGDRDTYRSSDHPFKIDPALRLKGVPTLVHWTQKGPGKKLEAPLENAPAEAAASLVAAFIAQCTTTTQ